MRGMRGTGVGMRGIWVGMREMQGMWGMGWESGESGGECGDLGGNAGNRGGNAGNIIDIEKKMIVYKIQFSFFAEIRNKKKTKLELS